MATVGRVEAVWNSFIGAPGYSRFTFENPVSAADATVCTNKVRAFFFALANYLPTGLTVQVQQQVALHDEQTGLLVGEIAATSQPAVVTGAGSTTNGFAGGAGAFIGWKTQSIWQGRRVQGRTFLVPLTLVAESNGTLTAAAIAAITSAGNGMIAGSTPAFGVWARKYDKTSGNKPVQIDGSFFLATSVSVPDKSGILRSRRD